MTIFQAEKKRVPFLRGRWRLTHLEMLSIDISRKIRLAAFITPANFYSPLKMELMKL